jgi:hypothetical protein
MSDEHDPIEQSTVAMPPQPHTYDHGWQAWQAVLGRMSQADSPDARLRIEVSRRADAKTVWAVEVQWSARVERTSDHPSLGAAFKALSDELTRFHWEFDDSRSGLRRYDPDDWLDAPTSEALGRLVETVETAFGVGWSLAFSYQPIEMPDQRVQGRLVARAGSVAVAGRGRTVLAAVRDVLRSAAPHLPKRG